MGQKSSKKSSSKKSSKQKQDKSLVENTNNNKNYFLILTQLDPISVNAIEVWIKENDIVDLNTADDYDAYPLFYACQNEHVNLDVIKYLVEKGAQPKIINNDNRNVLDFALTNENITPMIIRFLINKGVSLIKKDDYLSIVVKKILDILVNNNMNQYDLNAQQIRNFIEIGILLIENGANPAKTYGKSKTILEYAIERHPAQVENILALLVSKDDGLYFENINFKHTLKSLALAKQETKALCLKIAIKNCYFPLAIGSLLCGANYDKNNSGKKSFSKDLEITQNKITENNKITSINDKNSKENDFMKHVEIIQGDIINISKINKISRTKILEIFLDNLDIKQTSNVPYIKYNHISFFSTKEEKNRIFNFLCGLKVTQEKTHLNIPRVVLTEIFKLTLDNLRYNSWGALEECANSFKK